MKAKELAALLMNNPEFEVEFSFMDFRQCNGRPDSRTFNDIGINDISYMGEKIKLCGTEEVERGY